MSDTTETTVPLQPDEKPKDNKAALADLMFKLLDLEPAELHQAKTIIDGAIAVHEGAQPDVNSPVLGKPENLKVLQAEDRYERKAWTMYGMLCMHGILEPISFGAYHKSEVVDVANQLNHFVLMISGMLQALDMVAGDYYE
jgi:hypothetical protein